MIIHMNNNFQPLINLTEIQIELKITDGIPQIKVDKLQIQQVILNLLKNAIEALGEKADGSRKIVVGSRQVGSSEIEVSVSDNARGLASDIADKIFESFFTTKPEGLGIGLSLSKRIIEAHKGRIFVDLDSTDETIFKFVLPMKGGANE